MNKTIKTGFFALLMIALISIPLANSAVPIHHKATHAYIGATPNPIGVGQQTLIHLGITDELQLVQYGWEGLTVTVIAPDNTTETLGPFRTDSTGGTGYAFTPDQTGTYYLQTNFPAQWFNWTTGGGANIWYEASISEKLALVVNEEARNYYQSEPLPTEYWTRPINDQLRDWYQVAGNWLAPTRNEGPFVPENANAPDSSHILWSKPLATGGLVGDILGPLGYENGDAYEGLWGYGSPVIINGIMYYNNYKDIGSNKMERTVSAVDTRTGAEIWNRALIGPDNTSQPLQFGQIYNWISYNYQGAFSFLWTTSGSTWNAFNTQTGRWEYSITNVPSGTTVRGPNGEFLIYTLDSQRGWMTLWNSTRLASIDGSYLRNALGTTFNVSWNAPRNGGYEWNVTVPKGLTGGINVAYYDKMVLGSDLQSRTATANIEGRTGSPINFWALNTKVGQAGQLMYNKSWQPPSGNLSLTFERSSPTENVFTVWSKELRGRFGFNLDTGNQIWGPTEPEHYLQVFGLQSNIAYGKLFSTGYGGTVYAYDVKTGDRLWNYTVNEPYGGSEVLWSSNWPMALMFITDNKIYVAQAEHSANQPLPRGGPFLALDQETGNVVFRIDGAFRQPRWAGQAGIADGIISFYNTYDNQVYSIGKGPSQTTVTASPKTSTFGDSILIEGTVNDISAGTQDPRIAPRFPNGVPAVSEESMNDWMKYVYMQFPQPTNTTGIQVSLSVLDANGNIQQIGNTTTDASGKFSYLWTPEISGKHTVIATFAGSISYWGSNAETAVGVNEAAQATPTQSLATQPPFETYFAISTIAIIAAIVIIGLVLLKKKSA